jgi:hypothetical protein
MQPNGRRIHRSTLPLIVLLTVGCAGAPTSPTPTPRELEPRPKLPALVDGEADACLPECASGIVESGSTVPAGIYQTQWFFGGAFTIEVGEGWKLREDSTGEFGLTPEDDPLEYGIVFWLDPLVLVRDDVAAQRSADGFLGVLADHPDLVVSAPRDAAIGINPAHSVDVRIAPNAVSADRCPIEVCVDFIDYPEWTVPLGIGGDDVYRIIAADVTFSATDHLFVAMIEGQDQAYLDEFAPTLSQLIGSVQIPAHPRLDEH